MDLVRRHRALLAAVALAAAGLGAGWYGAASAVDITALVGPSEPWREPSSTFSDPAASLAVLTARPLWTTDAAAKAAGKAAGNAAPSWRLAGIIADGGQPVAVILLTEQGKPGGHPQYRRTGDDLPDGSRILEIGTTAITIDDAGKRRQVKLFFRN